MGGISCEQESGFSSRNLIQQEEETETQTQNNCQDDDHDVFCQETEDIWHKLNEDKKSISNSGRGLGKSKKKKNHVLLEGYVEVINNNSNNNNNNNNHNSNVNEDDLKRTKSLTDEDLDELKGCVDLGFGFSYDEIPELCNTLPALELCYSMSQKFLDEQQKSPERSSPAVAEAVSSPIANWKISSPGDHPEDVKARLKYWAQAVACTVRLCS